MDVREGTELTALTEPKGMSNHGAAGKRRYEKPEVIDFGDVRDLTLGAAAGSTADGFGMRKVPGHK